MVVNGVNIFGEIPSRPCRRIEAVTVFTSAGIPLRRRSHVILGARTPHQRPDPRAQTLASISARRAACGPGGCPRTLAHW